MTDVALDYQSTMDYLMRNLGTALSTSDLESAIRLTTGIVEATHEFSITLAKQYPVWLNGKF